MRNRLRSMSPRFSRGFVFGGAAAFLSGTMRPALAQAEPAQNTVNGVRQSVDLDDIPPEAPPEVLWHACRKCSQAIVLDGWLGGGATRVIRESNWSAFAGIGFTGLYEHEWFEAGAEGRLEIAGFGPDYMTLAGLVGAKTEPEPWLRLELLADVGAETVDNAGSGLFTRVTGGSATQPYLGGRTSVSFLLGESHRFLLGWWFNGGDAVGESVVHPWVQTCFLGCEERQQAYTIGGPSWSTGIRIGAVAAVW